MNHALIISSSCLATSWNMVASWWIPSPALTSFIVAIAVAGESYALFISDRLLPPKFRSDKAKVLVAKVSTAVLVAALFVEPLTNMVSDRIKNAALARVERIGEWRVLSDAQVAALQNSLLNKGKVVAIRYMANDPEAQAFAIQLASCFKGWAVWFGSMSLQNKLMFGLQIGDDSDAELAVVRKAFRDADVPFDLMERLDEFQGGNPSFPPGEKTPVRLTIIVGSKRRP